MIVQPAILVYFESFDHKNCDHGETGAITPPPGTPLDTHEDIAAWVISVLREHDAVRLNASHRLSAQHYSTGGEIFEESNDFTTFFHLTPYGLSEESSCIVSAEMKRKAA